MPGMDGITTTKYITRLAPQTKVIILSSHEDKKYLTRALMAGAKRVIYLVVVIPSIPGISISSNTISGRS
ncbi:MAG: response regulator [Cyanobacteria bacterium J06633_1]